MSTIFIVTYGNWSDYHIREVFKNEADAKEYISKEQRGADMRVEQWIIK